MTHLLQALRIGCRVIRVMQQSILFSRLDMYAWNAVSVVMRGSEQVCGRPAIFADNKTDCVIRRDSLRGPVKGGLLGEKYLLL